MATETEWKIGRKFSIIRSATIEGRLYSAGQTFEVSNFGRIISPEGRAITISIQARTMLGDIAYWLDDPCRISPALKRLIATDPKAKFVRELVRSEVGAAPKKAETPNTAEGWMEFIKAVLPPVPATSTASGVAYTNIFDDTITMTPIGQATNAEVDGRDRIRIRVVGSCIEGGRCDWTKSDQWSGEMDIPREVILRGEMATKEYVRRYYEDWLTLQREGDIRYDYDDDRDETVFNIQDWNAVPIIRIYQQRYAAEVEALQATTTAT